MTRNMPILRSGPQLHYFSGCSRPICAHLIAPVSLRAVERGVSHLDQLNRIARILGIRCDADANRDVMRAQCLCSVATHHITISIGVASRSEEHTSELQSLAYLVCR